MGWPTKCGNSLCGQGKDADNCAEFADLYVEMNVNAGGVGMAARKPQSGSGGQPVPKSNYHQSSRLESTKAFSVYWATSFLHAIRFYKTLWEAQKSPAGQQLRCHKWDIVTRTQKRPVTV